MDFLYASAEVHTLPPRKRLGSVLRDVAHSPMDLGSKKARLAGEAYVRAALLDPRLMGKSLQEIAADESGGSFFGDESDRDAKSLKKKGRNASSSSLTTANGGGGGDKTEKKKKKLTTKSERSTTPGLTGDDDTISTGAPKELTDEEMAMKLHLEMNASPRVSRGSNRSSQMLAGRALFS
jgi:phosphorylated CTD-interacting factor 1